MSAQQILKQIESQIDLRQFINKDQLRTLRAHCEDIEIEIKKAPKAKPIETPEELLEPVLDPTAAIEGEDEAPKPRSRKRRG